MPVTLRSAVLAHERNSVDGGISSSEADEPVRESLLATVWIDATGAALGGTAWASGRGEAAPGTATLGTGVVALPPAPTVAQAPELALLLDVDDAAPE